MDNDPGPDSSRCKRDRENQLMGSRLNIGHFCRLLSNVDRSSENRIFHRETGEYKIRPYLMQC
jgi:hypothetical protein